MRIQANGEDMELADNTSVTSLLDLKKVSMPDMVSVELNGDILARETFGTTLLKEGDRVEFLYFMGGGAPSGEGGNGRIVRTGS